MDLGHVSAGARVRDHVDRALLVEVLEHRARDVLGRGAPDIDRLVVALLLGDEAAAELTLDVGHALIGLGEQVLLGRRNLHVDHADRDPRHRGVVEADRLDPVDERRRRFRPEVAIAARNELLQRAAVHHHVHEAQLTRERRVEDHPARGRLDQASHQRTGAVLAGLPHVELDLDRILVVHVAERGGHDHLVGA